MNRLGNIVTPDSSSNPAAPGLAIYAETEIQGGLALGNRTILTALNGKLKLKPSATPSEYKLGEVNLLLTTTPVWSEGTRSGKRTLQNCENDGKPHDSPDPKVGYWAAYKYVSKMYEKYVGSAFRRPEHQGGGKEGSELEYKDETSKYIRDTKVKSNYLKIGFMKENQRFTDEDIIDRILSTESITPAGGIIVQTIGNTVKLSWDDSAMQQRMNRLQTVMTELEIKNRNLEYDEIPVAYGILRKRSDAGAEKEAGKHNTDSPIVLGHFNRACDYFKVTEKTVFQFTRKQKETEHKRVSKKALWTSICAQALKDWCEFDGRPMIAGFDHGDYCALVDHMFLGTTGTGEIDLTRSYTVTDIYSTMKGMLGMGFTRANMFPPGSQVTKDFTEFEHFIASELKWLKFCILFAMAVGRIKAIIETWEITKVQGMMYELPQTADACLTADLPDVGSVDTHYYPVSRNYLDHRASEMYFPCTMRMEGRLDLSDREVSKRANRYHPRIKSIPGFSTLGRDLVVTDGKVEAPPKIGETDEVYWRIRATNDAMLSEKMFAERNIFSISWNLDGLVLRDTSKLGGTLRALRTPEKVRRFWRMVSLLSMGGSAMKDATIMDSRLVSTIQGLKFTKHVNIYGEEMVTMDGESHREKAGLPTEAHSTLQASTAAQSKVDRDSGPVKPSVAKDQPVESVKGVSIHDPNAIDARGQVDINQNVDPVRDDISREGKDAKGRLNKHVGADLNEMDKKIGPDSEPVKDKGDDDGKRAS